MDIKNMEKHVPILGTLFIAYHIPIIIAALIVFTAVVGGGIISGDPEAIGITTIVGTSITFFLMLFAIPGLICGIGILKRLKWARVFSLIVGCLNLLSIPFGTALGIYTIWFMISDEAQVIFSDKPLKSK